ncbi:lipocalin-like domain-containing protein [Sulfuricystis multivorans]|uniref:lipocalin-like domain-containing protein n=1 Tax=Sulfuricystis multivorans TaxID=2211108 RepID=UPI000F81A301|nr:lipocalin-like domain-containing protein [Sulfuricystis multivorans]
MQRRRWLQTLLSAGMLPMLPRRLLAAAPAFPPVLPRPLVFPRDHGAHPEFRTEWWYLTGWLETATAEALGVQITFFRSRTTHDPNNPSRFAPHQLMFAHAALAGPRLGHLLHDQRVSRVRRDDPAAGFSISDTELHLAGWQLARTPDDRYDARIDAAGFGFELRFSPTQPLLLQGDGGYSRKGPQPEQASHYYSQPQLAVSGTVKQGNESLSVGGRAWLDHEWSSQLLAAGAAGWDWLGINLDDGGALMAFRIRPRSGQGSLWASARLRTAAGFERSFGPTDVHFEPLGHWLSPHTGTRYPVRCQLTLGRGAEALRFAIEPLLEDQELDARRSTGTVYWEGAVTLLAEGRRRGRGYLELTGYHRPMRL